jgi:NitT/TauT family transport system substrate-binding protein
MPAALQAKAIDGFIVAEPFCGKAELDGYGRVLYYAKDIWPNYISCCLVVHEDLIRDKPEIVRDLVRGIVASGEWVQNNRKTPRHCVALFRSNREADALRSHVSAGPRELRQLEADRRGDSEDHGHGVRPEFPQSQNAPERTLDRSFIPDAIAPATIDLTRMSEIIAPKAQSPR